MRRRHLGISVVLIIVVVAAGLSWLGSARGVETFEAADPDWHARATSRAGSGTSSEARTPNPRTIDPSFSVGATPGRTGPARRKSGRTNATPTSAARAAPPDTRARTPTARPRRPGRGAHPPTGAATRPITLAFAGDIHFEGHLRPLLDEPGSSLVRLRPELAAADLTVANLETAVTTRGEPEDKEFTFRTSPKAFDAVAAAGVDVVSMANNHGVDYGPEGLADTLAAAGVAPVGVVGIGADDDQAFAPHVATIRGTKVAVIGADAVADHTTRAFSAGPTQAGVASALDPTRLAAEVRKARQLADVVVVYLHWGTELESCPTTDQRLLARELAAAGADVVAGTHAHVQLAAGKLDGYDTFVAYGLGNFVWYNRSSERTTSTGVLTLTLEGRSVTGSSWAPAMIGEDGVPSFASGGRAAEMRSDWAALRGCSDVRAVPEPPV
ncbi:CapA family protein [Actinopolymorpha sp. B11F2]|uniref:CapA family protein n=1 Tax=Actinopolymorpha sp. B11F2 TaxID=3160862 RepID=UPI0032E46FBF